MTDQIQRFLFDDLPIRGQHVQLSDSYLQATALHQYPAAVQQLLGEIMVATSLLSTTLKFDGRLILQAKGTDKITLLMAECDHQQGVRALAQLSSDLTDKDFEGLSFQQLLGQGQLSITIEPDKGQRYQGIVALDGENLSQCLEQYFSQSEQLPTRLFINADAERAAGMLLQVLPDQDSHINHDMKTDDDGWNRISQLADTLSPEELLQLDSETLLYRLYHEETVRMFEKQKVHFACSCSEQRCATAIISLGQVEAEDILKDQKLIEMNCQFCNSHYRFDQADVAALFAGSFTGSSSPNNSTLH